MSKTLSIVLGLTGGIGSGKSAAAECFAALGAPVVDTDQIAHALTGPDGPALPGLRAAFGPAIFTPAGTLDRAALRRRVFADPAERARLEALLHPMIRAEAEARLRRLAGVDFSYAVLVVPLLVETGAYRECIDRIVVVDCPEALQIERVMARSGLSRQEVEAILATQATREARRAVADDIIHNEGSLAALQTQVAALHARYLKAAIEGAFCPSSG